VDLIITEGKNMQKEKYIELKIQAIQDRMPAKIYDKIEDLLTDPRLADYKGLNLLHIVVDKIFMPEVE